MAPSIDMHADNGIAVCTDEYTVLVRNGEVHISALALTRSSDATGRIPIARSVRPSPSEDDAGIPLAVVASVLQL